MKVIHVLESNANNMPNREQIYDQTLKILKLLKYWSLLLVLNFLYHPGYLFCLVQVSLSCITSDRRPIWHLTLSSKKWNGKNETASFLLPHWCPKMITGIYLKVSFLNILGQIKSFASQCSSVVQMEFLIALMLTLRLRFSVHQFPILSRKCYRGPWICGF